VVLADAGTVMPTVTDHVQAEVVVVLLHQVTAVELQIIDIETSQLTELRDKASLVVQEYDLINKARIYTRPAAVEERADQANVHQIMPMTEK
jgi:hypothetical protein